MIFQQKLYYQSEMPLGHAQYQGHAQVPDTMIQNVGKDWYPDLTGSESRQQVERCREDAQYKSRSRIGARYYDSKCRERLVS